MKKIEIRKLKLVTVTVRPLDQDDLKAVSGGKPSAGGSCHRKLTC
jgi:hypothetical protein